MRNAGVAENIAEANTHGPRGAATPEREQPGAHDGDRGADIAENVRAGSETPSTTRRSDPPITVEKMPGLVFIDSEEERADGRPRRERRVNAHYDTYVVCSVTVDDKRMNLAIATSNETAKGDDAPTTFDEAWEIPEWKAAIVRELTGIEDRKTWREEILPDGRKAMKVRWVFQRKSNGAAKARLTACGYSQVEGIDYDETFAPTAAMDAVRVFFAIVASRGLCLMGYDVRQAFLNAELKEELYIRKPAGYAEICGEGEEGWALRLLKAIYGLKQASKAWADLLDKSLRELNFVPGDKEPCLYTLDYKGHFVMLISHVDDMAVASDSYDIIEEVMAPLKKLFEMTEEREPKKYVYFEIERDAERETLKLHQESYITAMLKRFGMDNVRAAKTPAETKLKLSRDDCPQTEEEKEVMAQFPCNQFWSMVGAIGYVAVCCRFDLMYIANVLKKYCSNPGMPHWEALERAMRYLSATRSKGLVFRRGAKEELIAYADGDYASTDVDERKSISGVVILFCGAAVIAISLRQGGTAQSTTEAEIYAIGTGATRCKYARLLLRDFRVTVPLPVPIMEDNETCALFVKDARRRRSQAKHIDVKDCYAIEAVKDGEIAVFPVRTHQQWADMFTKPLGGSKLKENCLAIGLQ